MKVDSRLDVIRVPGGFGANHRLCRSDYWWSRLRPTTTTPPDHRVHKTATNRIVPMIPAIDKNLLFCDVSIANHRTFTPCLQILLNFEVEMKNKN
jgi:hypothetical protein